jgi:hypothetical protein
VDSQKYLRRGFDEKFIISALQKIRRNRNNVIPAQAGIQRDLRSRHYAIDFLTPP